MPKKNTSPPKYSRHTSVQARVRVNGAVVYLGEFGSEASHQRYAEIIDEWRKRKSNSGKTRRFTVDQLALAYLEHAKTYYVKDRRVTGRFAVVKSALRYLIHSHGQEGAIEFTPRRLKCVRNEMVAADLSRGYVNTLVSIIKRAFNWAASEELIDGEVAYALQSVEGLRKGRSGARETEPVKPVDERYVDTILPILPRQVAAMVDLQMVTGMRPGEVKILRPCDITKRTDGLWSYRPSRHKTEHHSEERVIYIGERGQEILGPWINCKRQEYCFSPPRGPNRLYSKNAYRQAIQ